MTFYITPSRRINRMRNIDRYFTGYPRMEDESEIYFPIDVKAEDEAYIIQATLPGLNPDDVSIQIVNETVSLQGEFKVERDEAASYLLQERPVGKFCRVLTLPAPLDSAKAEAEMVNGILTLRVPKAEAARPKTIKVTTK